MRFIVGIGNPGKKYVGTRHNIGFQVLEAYAKKTDASKEWADEKKLNALVFRTENAVLLKPKTFVNHTGDAVLGILKYHQAKPADILVVSDDVNLDFGKLRLRPSGSAGGHHGIESVIGVLQSEEFPRLRFGVRSQGMPKDLAPFVLDPFDAEEKKEINSIVERAVLVCQSWVEVDFQEALLKLSQLQGKKEK